VRDILQPTDSVLMSVLIFKLKIKHGGYTLSLPCYRLDDQQKTLGKVSKVVTAEAKLVRS